jgi:hypothetical protein
MLAWTLRGRMDHQVSAAGAKLALQLAQSKMAADSTAQMSPKPGGVVTPAPGGAPIPNDNGAPVAPPPSGTKKP